MARPLPVTHDGLLPPAAPPLDASSAPHTLSSFSSLPPLLDCDRVGLDELPSSHLYSPGIPGAPMEKPIQRVVGFRNTKLKSQESVITEAKG